MTNGLSESIKFQIYIPLKLVIEQKKFKAEDSTVAWK